MSSTITIGDTTYNAVEGSIKNCLGTTANGIRRRYITFDEIVGFTADDCKAGDFVTAMKREPDGSEYQVTGKVYKPAISGLLSLGRLSLGAYTQILSINGKTPLDHPATNPESEEEFITEEPVIGIVVDDYGDPWYRHKDGTWHCTGEGATCSDFATLLDTYGPLHES